MSKFMISEDDAKALGPSQQPSSPQPAGEDRLTAVMWLTVLWVLFGIVAVIVGVVMATDSYFNKGLYVFSGIGAAMVSFTNAAVCAACDKYLRSNGKK